ncbi:MAG: cupin domain-containing protein [Nitrospinota bacterium]
MSVEVKRGNSKNYDEVVRTLNGEGCFNIFKWSDPPGSDYGWHTHPHDEVRWVLKGSILIGTDNGDVLLKAGDRLNVRADTRHWAKTVDGVTYVCASQTASGGD